MTRKTIAATVAAPKATFALREVELDEPAADEVLVRIEATGMCHADLAVRDGDFPFPLPGVAGHEGAGVVERVGAAVTSVRAGQRVMLTFDSCGHCAGCVAGLPSQCREFVTYNFTRGARPDGSPALWRDGEPLHGYFFGQSSFAGYALARERNTVPVPESAADVNPELLAPVAVSRRARAWSLTSCGLEPGQGSRCSERAWSACPR